MSFGAITGGMCLGASVGNVLTVNSSAAQQHREYLGLGDNYHGLPYHAAILPTLRLK